MSGGSVRDRIAALQGNDTGRTDGSPTARRGHKLSLKTDEHIKEEFLRRGDGGWSKQVDIGHHQRFMAPPTMPPPTMPFIKVTSETPVAAKPDKEFPGKLPRVVPTVYETIPEIHAPRSGASRPILAEQRLTKKEKQAAEEQDAALVKYESLLSDEENAHPPQRGKSRHHSRTTSRKAYVEGHDEAHGAEEQVSPREKVIFDPVAWNEHDEDEKHDRIKHRLRKSNQRKQGESRGALDMPAQDQLRARSRSSRTRSERQSHPHHEGSHHEHPRRKHSSRSRSRHERHVDAPKSPPENTRRSSHFLWPSFAQSERRSMTDMFDTASIRPRSSHSRPRSDVSTTSTHTDLSRRNLEFAEYIAGKKLEHLPNTPLKPLPKPMGYVRSRSSTGEYSEYYTREKRLLRKPSGDEVVRYLEHDRGRKERRHPSWHDGKGAEAWQVKIVQGIART